MYNLLNADTNQRLIYRKLCQIKCLNVSESDILGLIDYFSDIDNLVSFEKAMFAAYNFKY